MGIASMIVGIISLLLGFIPICGAIALIPAIVGLILGIVDTVLKTKKGEKKGMSIAGIITCSIAIIIILFWIFILSDTANTISSQTTDSTLLNFVAEQANVDNKTKEAITTAAKAKEYYSIGEEGRLNGASITVTNIEKSQGAKYTEPKAGKEFIIVYLTIENKGTTNLNYNPYDFKMQNSQGYQEDYTYKTLDEDTELHYGTLIPGGKISGSVSFEQPIDDPGLILIYDDNIWDTKELKIKLN